MRIISIIFLPSVGIFPRGLGKNGKQNYYYHYHHHHHHYYYYYYYVSASLWRCTEQREQIEERSLRWRAGNDGGEIRCRFADDQRSKCRRQFCCWSSDSMNWWFQWIRVGQNRRTLSKIPVTHVVFTSISG